ncbi:class I SAM-dependent methyltransferase [Silicimonas sp. MF1-12-2]|uniref:class I SAM-dependent methyltransferase n=1 Tax=Silicimonas sp. MF1-12-2 TaxID=3384793 RepID=UPI0039B5457B
MKRLAKLIDGGMRMLEQERLVGNSGYFNADWYARTYPDAGTPRQALAHFLREGTVNGNDPGPKFSTSAYLAANPDVREAGYNALVHFLRFGRQEGRGVSSVGGQRPEPLGTAAMERIAEAFDRDFYAATNPDLPEDRVGLQHFLGPGWRERRDPCAWFSVEHYLAQHEDIAKTGQNPFVHYLLCGCREARDIQRSKRAVFPRGANSSEPRRLAALAMVRNEGDIIRAFSAHLLALFDDIVIVDHMSDDGTGAFLDALSRRNRRVTVLRLEDPAYLQSVTMTYVVREMEILREADWVFLLDADEFLPFADRPQFETALSAYRDCPVIAMHWRNLVPEEYWKDEVQLNSELRFIAPPDLSPFRKIAFQPKRISLKRTVVAQGNHALIETLNGLEVPAFVADVTVLHLPVRSVDQLVLKLNQGVEAYRQMGKTRDAAHGTHWDQMLRATADKELSPELLNAVVVRYSEDKPELAPLSVESLLKDGHRSVSFDLALQETGVGRVPTRSMGELLMRLHAIPAPDREVQDCVATTRVEFEGRVLRRSAEDWGAEYGPLPEVTAAADDGSAYRACLSQIFASSYRDIADLVPSQKQQHIPFLMAATGLVLPRRLAEIGTLRGASFLALCQAVREGEFQSEAIAVSGWAVDRVGSDDYRNAFETFSFLATKYADFAAFLRQRPEDAVLRFADGSLDLLHLDGFREEKPLRRALEVWLPKLSSRGVLLMHDTNARDGEFAVWRVWEDLAERYPAMEMPHANGMGLACIGNDVPSGLPALCLAMREDRHLRSLVHQHFDRLGKMACELFSRRFDMAQGEARARAEAAQAEELSWLRQEVDSLKGENDELRELLKGNLAHAISG